MNDADLGDLLPFYQRGRAERDFDLGIQRAIERLLVSSQFLFRIERQPKDVAAGAPYRISDLELASRLSFFLWSSIPDDEWLERAERGELRDPAVLEQQVTRMLQHPKAEALAQIAQAASPAAVLLTSSPEGKEIAARLAIKLESGIGTDAVGVGREPATTPSRLAGGGDAGAPGGAPPRDGATVPALVGVVSTVAADVHAIEPTAPVRILPDNPRPRAPARVGGALRIATLNAHDFFTTLGDRGAATRQEYALQRDKLAAALAGLNADVLLLDEVEANGMRSEDIAESLHVSKRTIDFHRRNILRKANLSGLTQLIAMALYFVSNLT